MDNVIYKVCLFHDTPNHREERGVPKDELNSSVLIFTDRAKAYAAYKEAISKMDKLYKWSILRDATMDNYLTVNLVLINLTTGKSAWLEQSNRTYIVQQPE